MKFYLNELSLHNQYSNKYEFSSSLKEMLKCRDVINNSGYTFYCSNKIFQQKVFQNMFFQQAVMAMQDSNIIRSVMIWITKNGPFWDELSFRIHTSDDYLECENLIVTDFAIGEAACQHSNNKDSCCVSFKPSNYQYSPLVVKWHKKDFHVSIDVLNVWECEAVRNLVLNTKPVIASWDNFIERAKSEFKNLVFINSFIDNLKRETFNLTIAERAIELLNILNNLKFCFDNDGERTLKGHEIIRKYFHGSRALFSDESTKNKIKFKKELTFSTSEGETIFCPYHGKISHRTFRLHFSWPIRKDKALYVVYLGQKLTRN